MSLSVLSAQPGQDYTAAVEDRLAGYNASMAGQEVDQLLNFVYPAFFELVPRDMLREQLVQQNTHPDLDIRYGNFRSVEIGELLESDGKSFVRVRYRYQMTLELRPAAAESGDYVDAVLSELQNRYGERNVRYLSATGTIEVQTSKKLLAVRPDEDLEWYFLEYDSRQAELVEGLVPREIRQQL